MCFAHFDLEMCFAPQRRALFRHLNFQKWYDVGVFCTFGLPKLASRHNGVQLFISSAPAALASLLFDPPEPQIIGKTVFCDFPTFSRTCIFFLLTFSSLIFSLLLFSSLNLPTSAVPSVHNVGNLTSQLPSTILYFLGGTCADKQTYIHTYKHTYIHTYLHTYIQTNIHTYIHTYNHSFIHFISFLFISFHFFSCHFISFIHSLIHSLIH